MSRPSSLPVSSQQLVLSALRHTGRPMTAYGLLETLSDRGIKSPPIVYRALDALVKAGSVHRIEAINAFVACSCHADHTHELSVLTVCRACRRVEELHKPDVMKHLAQLSALGVRLPPQAVIELPVLCEGCS